MNAATPAQSLRVCNTVQHGDCVELMRAMPDKSIDHVITDPPYSAHTHKNVRRDLSSERNDLGFASLSDELRRACAAEFARRIVRRWILIFCDDRTIGSWISDIESVGLEFIRLGVWVKPGCTPQFTGDRPSQGSEYIIIAHPPGRKKWNGGGGPAIYTIPRSRGRREHTTQKPLALMSALLRDFTHPGDVICDPFAGSGSTILVANMIGRLALGVGGDERYVQTANRRISLAREQMDLLPAVAHPRAKQRELRL